MHLAKAHQAPQREASNTVQCCQRLDNLAQPRPRYWGTCTAEV